MKRIYVFQAQMENPHLRPGLVDPASVSAAHPGYEVISRQNAPCPVTTTDILEALSSPTGVLATERIQSKIADVIAAEMGTDPWNADRFEVRLIQGNFGFLVFVETAAEAEGAATAAEPEVAAPAAADATEDEDATAASDDAARKATTHYVASHPDQPCSQVVLCVTSDANAPAPRKTRVFDAFLSTGQMWAGDCVVVGTRAQVLIKSDGATDWIRDEPMRLAVATYAYEPSGIVQFFVHFESEAERGGMGPFVVERSFGPTDPSLLSFLRAIYKHREITVRVGEACDSSGATIEVAFVRKVVVCDEVVDAIRQQIHAVTAHHVALGGTEDYEAALAAYNRDNPLQGNPILREPPPRRSRAALYTLWALVAWNFVFLAGWAGRMTSLLEFWVAVGVLFGGAAILLAIGLGLDRLAGRRAAAAGEPRTALAGQPGGAVVLILCAIALALNLVGAVRKHSRVASETALTEWMVSLHPHWVEGFAEPTPDPLRPGGVIGRKVLVWDIEAQWVHSIQGDLDRDVRAKAPAEVGVVFLVDTRPLSGGPIATVFRVADGARVYRGQVYVGRLAGWVNSGRWLGGPEDRP